jgi:hypothetical protein
MCNIQGVENDGQAWAGKGRPLKRIFRHAPGAPGALQKARNEVKSISG